EAGLEALVEVIANARVDGIVVCNTTRSRPSGLRGRLRREGGGLSGRPLFHASTEMLRRVYRLTGGGTPLVGVGGVASGADAYAKVRAGASLVQLYTALVFHGPGLIGRIKTDLAARLRADGFSSMAEAAGADHQ
ncbi:MAG: dihydroorotate dehydrogenase (quinone), partial [Alphaproteobacteria bacterium]